MIMDAPTTPTFAFRRSTRTALTEIPTRHAISATDNPRHFAVTNLVPRGPNLNRSPDSVLSPEELVIQQRGRRRLPVTWSPDIDAKKREGPLLKEKTPIKMQGKESLARSSTLVLRSSPRKRLLLNDPREAGLGSPEKCMRKVSPTKKLRSEKFSHPLFPISQNNSNNNNNNNNNNSNNNNNGTLSAAQSSSVQSALKGLSQEQLIHVLENILLKYPHLEPEIKEILPTPDIKPLEEKLMYLKKNIFKSLPNSRLTSKTDSPAYSRAATHVIAFKKCVIEQGKTLLDSQHWKSVLDYVLIAWGYVKATPLWDNPPHNASRKQCFKSLAAMAISALKKGSWNDEEIEEIYARFKNCDEESEDIQTCLKQINSLLRNV